MFFDDDRPEKEKIVADVEWRIVSLHCAALMKDAGYTPPRYWWRASRRRSSWR
jgi:hypothetical protein